MTDAFAQLHPALQYHVVNTLGWSQLRPTQLEAIAPIQSGAHCLLLAPTAGGKTEAAVLPVLSRILLEGWPATSVLYLCPIKALLNDLEHRLTHYAGLVGLRVAVWHGDVSQSAKRRAMKDAPDILLTTPESLEAMLISTRVERARWFGQLRAVVVDELHAFAVDDRGWHLRAVLHRLAQYTAQPLQRIGLSATVSNPQALLAWFAPQGERQVVGQAQVSTDADVTIDHVGSLENAGIVVSRLYRGEKRLVFCDSRSSAEQLGSLLRGHGVRTFISHASLSASERRLAEAAFAQEKDCVIVATSTLELGLDVGDLDRVIQIDAPSTVSSFLQRMGRTGRRSGSRRNCLFLTTSDDALLLALGLTQRWSETWVEAAVPPAEPWPLVAQQALVATLERGEWPRHELVTLLQGAFGELPPQDIARVVTHLVDEDFLDEAENIVRIGPRTERDHGRGHYRDLLASFSGPDLLTGKHGSAEVGYIDPTVLTGEHPQRVLLLAGRSWRVVGIEWSRRTVWLEPIKEGGTARWMGSARSLSREVCQGIRAVLANGAPSAITLSRRAKLSLTALTEDMGLAPQTQSLVTQDAQGPRTWTFAGTMENRTLAHQAGQGGVKVRFDALSVRIPFGVQLDVGTAVRLNDPERAALGDGIKFHACVPDLLLDRTIIARLFSVLGSGT